MKTFKKSVAVLLALLVICSAFGAAGSAAEIKAPKMSSRSESKVEFKVELTGVDLVCVEEGKYSGVSDENIPWDDWAETNHANVGEGTTTIEVAKSKLSDLDANYTIICRKINASGYDFSKSESFKFRPAAPVIESSDSTSVTLKKVDGVLYGIKVKGASEFTWGTKNTLSFTSAEGYKEGDTLVVAEKYFDLIDNTAYYSMASEYEMKTLASAYDKPGKPVLLKTGMSEISVKSSDTTGLNIPEGVEFSIDNGETWNSTGVFSGLNGETEYFVYARAKFNKDERVEGDWSEQLHVRTASRDAFVADVYDCKITVNEDSVSVGKKVEFEVEGSVSSDKTPIAGDTRFIPVSWVAVTADGATVDSGSWTDGKGSQKASVDTKGQTAGDQEKIVKITVTFEKQEYSANSDDSFSWKRVSTNEKVDEFTLKAKLSFLDTIFTVLNVILTVFNKGVSLIANGLKKILANG